VLDSLGRVWDKPEKEQLERIGSFLLGREEWELSKRFFEHFPQAENGWVYVMVKHWIQSGEPGEQIDEWLEQRTGANPKFWIVERARFRKMVGTEEEFLEELAADVRANPTDVSKANLYLDAMTAALRPLPDWIGKICRPKLAYASYRLGQRLLSQNALEGAESLLEYALKIPVTAEELKMINSHSQVGGISDEDFTRWVKKSLVECYRKLGKVEEEGRLVKELVEESDDSSQLAGQRLARLMGEVRDENIRGAFEEKLKGQERIDSPEYWLARAHYYAGGESKEEAEKAFLKALELSPKEPDRFKKPNVRSGVLRDYCAWLSVEGRASDAFEMLREELRSHEINAGSVSAAVGILTDKSKGYWGLLNPEDEVLWRYLGRRDKWDGRDERFLRTLAELAVLERPGYGPPGRPLGAQLSGLQSQKARAFAERGEKLVKGADASRAKVLGEVLIYTRQYERAVPVLVDAASQLESEHERKSAAFSLFRAYLQTGKWKEAEAAFLTARPNLGSEEDIEWYGRISLAAAEAGDFQDAMRLWKTRSNIDLADLRGLEALAKAGMREHLRSFYLSIQEIDPASWVPAAALEVLQ
jgi:tetratricopeptide (TPR) repeat protein